MERSRPQPCRACPRDHGAAWIDVRNEVVSRLPPRRPTHRSHLHHRRLVTPTRRSPPRCPRLHGTAPELVSHWALSTSLYKSTKQGAEWKSVGSTNSQKTHPNSISCSGQTLSGWLLSLKGLTLLAPLGLSLFPVMPLSHSATVLASTSSG